MAAASTCREGSQIASKSQARPVCHQADTTLMRVPQVAGEVKPPYAKLLPKEICCYFVLAGTHLQFDRQPKRTGFGKNTLKHQMCYFTTTSHSSWYPLLPQTSILPHENFYLQYRFFFSPFISQVYVHLSKTNM